MKKAYTRGEKLLLVAPLLFVAIAGATWQWQKVAPDSLEFTDADELKLMEFSPDGKRLATIVHDPRTNMASSSVWDLNAQSKCELETPPRLASLMAKGKTFIEHNGLSWSPDGKRVLVSYATGQNFNAFKIPNRQHQIAIWDAQSGAVTADFPYAPAPSNWTTGEIRFSSDGQTLIGEGVPPARYSVATGRRLNQPSVAVSPMTLMRTNEKLGLFAALDAQSDSLRVVDIKTNREVWRHRMVILQEMEWCGDVLCVRGSPQDEKSWQGEARLWLWNGKTRQLMPSPTSNSIGEWSASSDGRTLAYLEENLSADKQNVLSIDVVAWDYLVNRKLWRTTLHTRVSHLQWSPDGKWLAVSSGDYSPYHEGTDSFESQTRIYVLNNLGTLQLQRAIAGDLVRWSPDSKLLATIGGDLRNVYNRRATCIEIHHFEE